MLTFLRKIRRSLIESGAARKYLLYAIGEIALVVIGILIALQINNWNEERKMIKTVKVYLSNLIEAIQDDSKTYTFTKESSDYRYYSSQYLLQMAGEISYDPNPDGHLIEPWKGNHIWADSIPSEYNEEFIRMAFLWTHRIDLNSETPSAVEELKKTVEYNNLKNETLKDAINEYYAESDFRLGPTAEEIYRRVIWAWQNALMDNGILNSNPFVKGNPIQLLKKNPALIGRLRGLAQESSWQSMSFSIMIDKGHELSSLIEYELSKM
jgi:hypothetical protein